jgi:hypothetical protein
VIVLALSAGVLILLGVLSFMSLDRTANEALDALKWVALFLSVQSVAVASFLPGHIRKRQIEQLRAKGAKTPDDFAPAYIAAGICGAAVIEGASIFNGVLWMLTGDPMTAGAAGAGALLIPALFYPTASRIQHWYEDLQQSLRNPRHS